MNSHTDSQCKNHNYTHPLDYSDSTSPLEQPEQNCFRFLLIMEGSGTLYMNSSSISVSPHNLLCLNEMELPKFNKSSSLKVKDIYFHPKLINHNFNYNNIRDSIYSFSSVEQQDCYLLQPFIQRDKNYVGHFSLEEGLFIKVSKLFDFVIRELQLKRDIYWPCRSRSFMLELLILTTKLFESRQNLLLEDPLYFTENTKNILAYLHNNYMDKITLDQLASIFATNRTTLNNEFLKATKVSIIDYLITLRINLAAAMLRDTLLPISEIMERVGFHDSSHFWRTFKKHTSLSPKEYREKYCWVED
ncbi:MAG TPA: AraC family transcriptional regulator [Lachnospiraceae bacterium]|nr:AraC family transcriptional regulator [Lachnospiraceae bacterium]